MDGVLTPATADGAAAGLAAAAAAGSPVRFRGGGTKAGWGRPAAEPAVEISLEQLDRTIEHNVGDLTAGFEAGAPLVRIQRELAAAGQRLALDPPLGRTETGEGATIGGVLATADSGPLRHRYGAPRDLVLGMSVALSDGTIARSGGKVIKNVAGYDLAKLFTGSFGTLGAILSANLRLHPIPEATATALAQSGDAGTLSAAAAALTSAPLELDCLDIAWRAGRGGLLAQTSGAQSRRRAVRVAELMSAVGLEHADVIDDDAGVWARQRAGQRSAEAALVRVALRPSRMAELLAAADAAGGTIVGRAALGIFYVELDPDTVESFRGSLPPEAIAIVQDAPAELRARIDPWPAPPEQLAALMGRVRRQFDPAGVCNPGVFVAGL
jgi:glycolate oxidase FAD binding subunit